MKLQLSGRLLVDIDATLYYAPFAEAARVIWGADCPPTREVDRWLWYKDYLTDDQWRAVVELVHNRLGMYKPFPMAANVLQMAQPYFNIIIISQRDPKYQKSVDFWLAVNKIPANHTVIKTESKLELFREGDIVIDDAPHNIIGALEKGAHVISLRYLYNGHTEELGAKLAEDWGVIGTCLKGVIDNVEREPKERDSKQPERDVGV